MCFQLAIKVLLSKKEEFIITVKCCLICRTNPASGISHRKPEQGFKPFPWKSYKERLPDKDFQNQEEGRTHNGKN